MSLTVLDETECDCSITDIQSGEIQTILICRSPRFTMCMHI